MLSNNSLSTQHAQYVLLSIILAVNFNRFQILLVTHPYTYHCSYALFPRQVKSILLNPCTVYVKKVQPAFEAGCLCTFSNCFCATVISQCFRALALGACSKGLLHACRSSITQDADSNVFEQFLAGESPKLSPANSGAVSGFVLFRPVSLQLFCCGFYGLPKYTSGL